MANTIDKKYTTLISGPLTKEQLNKNDSIIEAYTGSEYYKNQINHSRDVIAQWPYLFYQYHNKDKLAIYRGLSYKTRNFDDFFVLVNKIYSSKSITTKYARSWTTNPSIAAVFAYNLYLGKSLTTKDDDILLHLIIESTLYKGEGLDISGSSYYTEEDEVILPPGTFEARIASVYAECSDHVEGYLFNTNTFKRFAGYQSQGMFSKSTINIDRLSEFIKILDSLASEYNS